MQLERAPNRGSFKNAAKIVMQLERAPNRGSFKNAAQNVMQLERAPNRGSFKLGSKNAAQNVMQLERAPNRGSCKLGRTQQIPDLNSRAHRAYMQFHNQERQLISLCEIQKFHAARETDRNSSAGCSRFPLLYLLYSLF
jgi:hypothetical protein